MNAHLPQNGEKFLSIFRGYSVTSSIRSQTLRLPPSPMSGAAPATRPEALPHKVRFISEPWRAAGSVAFAQGA